MKCTCFCAVVSQIQMLWHDTVPSCSPPRFYTHLRERRSFRATALRVRKRAPEPRTTPGPVHQRSGTQPIRNSEWEVHWPGSEFSERRMPSMSRRAAFEKDLVAGEVLLQRKAPPDGAYS